MRTMHSIHARAARLRVLLAVAVAALFLQACAQDAATGGADDASAPAEQESSAPAASGSETSDEGDDSAGAGGEVAGIDLSADFCTISNQLEDSDVFDEEPANAEEFATTSGQIKEIYGALADKAPEEISDDVQVVTEQATRQIDLANELIADAQEDPAAVLEDPEVAEQLSQIDQNEEFTRATERVQEWTDQNC